MIDVTEEECERARQRSRRMYETDLTSDVLTAHSIVLTQCLAKRMFRLGFSVADILKTKCFPEEYIKDMMTEIIREKLARDGCYPYKQEEIQRILTDYGQDSERRLMNKLTHGMYHNGFSVNDIIMVLGLPEQEVKEVLGI